MDGSLKSNESVWVEQMFNNLLNSITTINPDLFAPYLEIDNQGDGLIKVQILIQIRPKGDSSNGFETF